MKAVKPPQGELFQPIFQIIAKQAPNAARVPGSARAAKAAPKQFPKIPMAAQARARAKRNPGLAHDQVFKPAVPPPGVLPKGTKQLAMDEAPGLGWAGAAGNAYNFAFAEGYTFLGYPYLSELAQVPEYRLISEVISTEATRKWIKIKSTADGDDAEDKSDKIRELEDEFKRLGVREAFATASMHDGLFGRSHLYLDTGQSDDRTELATPIGDGSGAFTKRKFGKKGFLRAIKAIEPVWTYPMNYNAQDPLADDWYKPMVWYVMAKPIHVSRLLTFIAKPVPDLLKPAFSFGGLSLSQMAKPYVDNWLETRQSVNDIIQAFSVMVLKTDLSTLLQGQGDGLFERADLFNDTRNNRGVMMVDKNTEDFANVSAPLGTLDKLQAQAQEHICSVSRIPLIKYTGISPSGLNASSDGEVRAFYDTIHAYQGSFFRPNLDTVFRLAQLNIWGKVDEDLEYDFEPLWEMDAQALVDMQKAKAETHEKYIGMGAIDGENVREALVDDPDSPYQNIDPEEDPDEVIMPENAHEKVGDDPDDEGGGAGGKTD